MRQWSLIAQLYTSWSFTEIKEMTYTERKNWLEVAREQGKVVKTSNE